jgi:DNA-binding NtrC family response regulator
MQAQFQDNKRVTARILLLDDEENVLRALCRVFNAEPYIVETFTSAEEALYRAGEVLFHLAISDYRMPEIDGVTFLSRFKVKQPDAMRLILSAYTDLNALLGAINDVEVYRFISKPWIACELKGIVAQAMEHRAMLMENRRLADLVRIQRGIISRQEAEFRRLEEQSPGITQVNWGEDGSIILNEEDC